MSYKVSRREGGREKERLIEREREREREGERERERMGDVLKVELPISPY